MVSLKVQPLNYAKLAPPQAIRALQRPRLTAALGRVADRKLVTIVAGAGFGKTTALAEFLSSISIRVAWYRLDKTDRDIVQFASYLVASIRGFYPTFGSATQRLLLSPGTSNDVDLIGVVAHDLSTLPADPFILALDGYDAIEASPPVNALLTYLLQFSPSHIRFYLTSRGIPLLPLAALRASNMLAEFGASDLALTDDEVDRFLHEIADIKIGDKERKLLIEKTEGWPVGVVLACQVLRQCSPTEIERMLGRFSGEAESVYAYLAEEVFRRLDPSLQAFLLRTSVFEDLYPSACDHLLGTTDALERLEQLKRDGLFTEAVTDPGTRSRSYFRYHRLFRGFLRERLKRTTSTTELRALHESAGRILESGDDWRGSLDCYFEAENYLAAANTLQRVGEELLETSALHVIIVFLERLPPEILWTRPWLLALRGRILRRQYRIDAACEALDRATALFERAGDGRGLSWIACEMAGVDYRRGMNGQAVRRLHSALRMTQEPALRAEMLARSAVNMAAIGDHSGALRFASDAEAQFRTLPLTTHNLSNSLTLGHARGLAHAMLGHVEETISTIREADRLEQDGGLAAHSIGDALGFSAEMALLIGDPAQALRRLDMAEPLIGNDPFWLVRIAQLRGDALIGLGDKGGAAVAYEVAGPAGWSGKAFVALLEQRHQDAARLAEMAWEHQSQSENAIARETARAILGIAQAAIGRLAEGAASIELAQRFFDEHQYVGHGAGLSLHHVQILVDSDPAVQAGEARRAIVRVLDAPGVTVPWWDPNSVVDLCVRILKSGLDTEPCLRLIAVRLGRNAVHVLRHIRAVPPGLHDHLLEAVRTALKTDEVWSFLLTDLSSTCQDHEVRVTVLEALGSGMTADAILRLRRDAHITWRELHVLLAYYLDPSAQRAGRPSGLRRDQASRLGISENTLKVHVANLRQKLGMAPRADFDQLVMAIADCTSWRASSR